MENNVEKGGGMSRASKGLWVKLLVVVTFVAMVVVNALANIMPLNGISTGAVSDSYPNLFAPAGFAFAIWGLIYLLLALYTLYQLGLFRGTDKKDDDRLLSETGILFSVSSLVNTTWIFTWHYRIIPLSMVLIATILICLAGIMHIIDAPKTVIQRKTICSPAIQRIFRLDYSGDNRKRYHVPCEPRLEWFWTIPIAVDDNRAWRRYGDRCDDHIVP